MTVVGTSVHRRQQVRVESVGSGPIDGWSSVARLRGADLPGGTGQWAFACWGQLGQIEGALFGTNATIEVCLGDQVGPFVAITHRLGLQDGHLRTPLRGHPFCYVLVYHATLAGARGSWSAANDLVLWARLALNGDPPNSVSATFRVANLSIVAVRASSLGATEFWADRFAPAQRQFNNPESAGFRTFHLSGVSGVFDTTGKKWLVFSQTIYHPGGLPGAPVFQTTVSPDGSVGAQVALTGRELKHGSGPRGAVPLDGARNQFVQGSFRVFTLTNTLTQLGLRGFDYVNQVGQTAGVVTWEAFAVRTDKLGFFSDVTKDQPAVGSIVNDHNVSVVSYEPLEYARPFVADLEVLSTMLWDNDELPTQGMSHFPFVGSNLGALPQGNGELAAHTFRSVEGQHSTIGLRVPNLRKDEVQFRAFLLQNPLEGNAAATYRKPGDFTIVAFQWENDPNFTPFAVTATGPDVVIVPAREATNLAALSPLPIEPDAAEEEDLEVPRHELEAQDGTRLTWPKFLSPRRLFTLHWSGQTRAQRDQLLEFFRAQDRRAFRWLPPNEVVAVALVLVGRPSATDAGVLHSLSASAVELAFISP